MIGTTSQTFFGGRRIATAGIVLLLSVLTALPAAGQSSSEARYTMMFRGVPLSKALVRIVDATNANLVYDAEMVEDEQVYCSIENASAEAILRCVLSDTPIDFIQTSAGTFVLTRSPRRSPRRGHLTGRVVDASTGEPLSDANVLLAAANTGVATDAAGHFQLPNLTRGTYRVVATHVGYEAAATTIQVSPGDSTHRTLSLAPQSVSAPPIVVTQTERRLPEGGLGNPTLSAADLRNSGPLGTADAIAHADVLLGVHAQRPRADLHVQGGATGEHQVRLDGVPIRNPVTLRRMLGAFSPLGLDRLTVRKAGYGVEHGSTVSGVLDARHALSTASPDVGQIQVDPLSINAEVHRSFQLGSNESAQVRVAARKSMWGAYRDPTLERLIQNWNVADPMLLATYFGNRPNFPVHPKAQTTSLDFSDVHAAARIDLGPYQSLRISGYRGRNRLRSEFLATSAASPGLGTKAAHGETAMLTQDRYDWQNRALQARLDWMLGPRTSTSLQVQVSEQQVHRGYQMSYTVTGTEPASVEDTLRAALDPGRWPDDHNRIREVGVEGTGSYSLSARHHLKASLEVSHLTSQFRLGNRFFRAVRMEDTSWQIGGYVRDVLSLGVGTTVNAGTRLTYIPARHTLYAEPRLTVQHEGTHAPFGDYAVRLAGGVYRQFVNRFDVSSTSPTSILPSLRFWLPAGTAHAPPRAYHTTLSGQIEPVDRWQIAAEGYLKSYPHLLALDYTALQGDRDTPVSPTQAIASSHGYAAGVGVAVSRRGSTVESTLRYDWTRSRRRFPSRFDGRLVPAPWTHPHRLVLSSKIDTGLGLHVRGRGTYASGQSWGFRQAYYDYLSTLPGTPRDGTPSFQRPGRDTLPPTFRLTLGAGYAVDVGTATMEVELTVANVLDRQNAFDWGLTPTQNGATRTTRSLPGRALRGTLSIRY